MEITHEYNVDCASQRMVIVKGEVGICLKGEVGQFSSLLPRIVPCFAFKLSHNDLHIYKHIHIKPKNNK
jgi:hypothetical protein